MFRSSISRPSRLLWIFVGAAGATYFIKRQVWAAKVAEWKEKKDIMLERGREGWDGKKEQVLARSRQLREENLKLAEVAEASLDKVSKAVEALKAKRAERDKQRLEGEQSGNVEDQTPEDVSTEAMKADRFESRVEGEENSNARVQGSLHKIKASIDGLKLKRSERREKRAEHSDNQPERDLDAQDS